MFVVSLVVFLSVRFIPGNVVDAMIAQMSSAASMSNLSRASLEHTMGLDVPIPIQYGRWLGVLPQENGVLQGLLEGDLGKSLWSPQRVTDLILQRLPVSIELTVIAVVTALAISLPLGVYSAVRQDTAGDGDIAVQSGQIELHGQDGVACGLQELNHPGPTRRIGPRSMHERDRRLCMRLH